MIGEATSVCRSAQMYGNHNAEQDKGFNILNPMPKYEAPFDPLLRIARCDCSDLRYISSLFNPSLVHMLSHAIYWVSQFSQALKCQRGKVNARNAPAKLPLVDPPLLYPLPPPHHRIHPILSPPLQLSPPPQKPLDPHAPPTAPDADTRPPSPLAPPAAGPYPPRSTTDASTRPHSACST